jgi:hypothetical protein
MKDFSSEILMWVSGQTVVEPPADFYCATRDVFQARLDSFRLALEWEDRFKNISSLLVAIVGEIGNNSFDHNIGNWRDIPGTYFRHDVGVRIIVCADRGQGVRTTLQKIRPEIQDDKEALHVAFTEKISGRSPEQRGNGLKFVRTIIKEQHWHLEMRSGDALATLNTALTIDNTTPFVQGCYVMIRF